MFSPRVACRPLALIAGLLAITIVPTLAHARGRVYHARLGRFMQRDPMASGVASPTPPRNMSAATYTQRDPLPGPRAGAGYQDGMNLYQYVSGSPVNYLDPTGLWKITRTGGTFASVEAEKDDTVATLAKAVGLEAGEFKAWLRVSGGTVKTPGKTKKLSALTTKDVWCAGQKAEVPNVVLAYWAGEMGGFGKWWVMWDMDVQTLKARGFNVREHQGWNAVKFQTEIQASTGAQELHGIFFWGHGYDWKRSGRQGVGTDSNRKVAGFYSDFAMWKPKYKLALGVLFACHTQNGKGLFSSNGVFWGKSGILYPHGFHIFGPTINSLLPPGAQGTKK